MTLPRIATGTTGLDTILKGGLPVNRLYLLEGQPGSGKTTLALQFLREGVERGERCLYVTLSETTDELTEVAASHGWSLDGIDLFELASAEAVLGDGRQQSILHPWEMELDGTVRLIQAEVERCNPTRIVFDSLSELRLLAQDALRYRRQVLSLKQFFAPRNITVILVDDLTGEGGERDAHLHSLCHGVLSLERLTLDFGAARRRMQVQKLRGVDLSRVTTIWRSRRVVCGFIRDWSPRITTRLSLATPCPAASPNSTICWEVARCGVPARC